ncbi:MAG: MFS transporter [Sandaracinaceae bacterium]|nr:MFS transporter [Sandaracinaceae bacterium]MBK7152247.1 MFS transporter [Sandaracinaceae bacterium]MBK7774616.1 MFS transporter [Sandaracinaceae bacterium]MBK8592833.1 MFS transporter [Sandaracinaceae bacterium]
MPASLNFCFRSRQQPWLTGRAVAAFTPYQRRLLIFLSVATFFEGYDFFAITQLLPHLGVEFDLDRAGMGLLLGITNIGAILAFFLVRAADRFGRRRLLAVTIAGYTLFTITSGLAVSVWDFGLSQLLAKVFLLAEWALAMVVAAEEFPAERRGSVIGIIQAFSALGSIVCAGVVPLLVTAPFGWRSVYFVGIVPLLALAYLRRGMQETSRFAATGAADTKTPLMHIWHTPYRGAVIRLASVWFFAYIAAQCGISFWKLYAMGEIHLTEQQAGNAIAQAALVAMPMNFAAGYLIDKIGRRWGATVIFATGSVAIYFAYTLSDLRLLTVALIFAVFSVSSYLPILNAYTTELFPTELRGSAFAWCNNILGRASYVFAPVLVGEAASRVGAYGPVVVWTAIFPLITTALVWALLPETKGLDLDETSALH